MAQSFSAPALVGYHPAMGVWNRVAWAPIALCSAEAVSAPAQNPPEAAAAFDTDRAYNFAADRIASSDPRERAWAAATIANRGFVALYPKLLAALSDFQPNLSSQFEATPRELALEITADAIIRAHVLVPAADARKLYPEFPALAMILLSRPVDDNRTALLSILNEAKTGEVWLAAANLLAVKPSPEFMMRQLDEFNVFTRILVFQPGIGGGMSYGDCASVGPLPQPAIPSTWPPLAVYQLLAGKSEGRVIATGANPVSFTSRVTVDPRPWTGHSDCGGPGIQALRRDLLLQLAGIDASSTALHAVVLRDVIRETDEQYRREALGILQEQAKAFADVVAGLEARGLITAAQAAERRLHMQVHIVDSGSTRALPALPDLRLLGIVGQYQQHSF
ncbi:MAG: hypothetical protein M3N54_05180 [Acidobacteriota bacterium]|nr:hypothetical protein [Acidobacteriota bacterium]